MKTVIKHKDLRTSRFANIWYHIKATPWDDINFRFYFRTEVVYPTDHVLIFFRICIFLQIFLINISMKPEETQTNYLYT